MVDKNRDGIAGPFAEIGIESFATCDYFERLVRHAKSASSGDLQEPQPARELYLDG